MLKKYPPLRLIKRKLNKELKLPVIEKKSQITFAPNFKKEFVKEKVDLFWKKYFSGEKKALITKKNKKGKLSFISNHNIAIFVFPVTPSVAGVVRKMSIPDYITYLKKYNLLKDLLLHANFKKTEVVLVEVLSFKEKDNYGYVLERVFPSISFRDYIQMYDVIEKKFNLEKLNINRYSSSFLKSLKENKIDPLKFYQDLLNAYKEIEKVSFFDMFDTSKNNFIILGYNKETGKVKFGLIDFYGANSKSF